MGGGDEPLKPVYHPQLPPWHSRYTGREYKGRKDWWNELGFHNEDEMNSKWKAVHYNIREKEPDWYDPKVEDGTSMANHLGLDSKFYKNMAKKGDTPGNLFEFQDKLMKSSSQYKAIAEKYNISAEHPGIAVSPSHETLTLIPKNYLGLDGAFTWPKSWFTWGPRFFDKPMNEGCFEKGGALAKYALLGNILYSGMESQRLPKKMEGFRFGPFIRVYTKNAPVPTLLAFSYGMAICTSATLRNIDDIYNPLAAASFTGIAYGTIKGSALSGTLLAGVLAIGGIFFHYQRIHRFGLQGAVQNQMYGGMWGLGPDQYKTAQTGKLDFDHMSFLDEVDPDRRRYPFCIVWTPIPFISWLFPFIGHMGIATSQGIIRDFAGSYFVAEDNMGFGWPTCYLQLDPRRVQGGVQEWDKAVREASDEYRGHMHNLLCDNCHSHVALALNTMKYDGKTNGNMFNLCFWTFFKGKRVGTGGWLKQFLPFFILISILGLVVFGISA